MFYSYYFTNSKMALLVKYKHLSDSSQSVCVAVAKQTAFFDICHRVSVHQKIIMKTAVRHRNYIKLGFCNAFDCTFDRDCVK